MFQILPRRDRRTWLRAHARSLRRSRRGGRLQFYLLPYWLLFQLDCQTLKNRCAFVQIDLEVFAKDVLDSIQVLLQGTITAHDFAAGLAAVARSHDAAHHRSHRIAVART